MEDKEFSGKVALVTGAANGIGSASAIKFAAKGAKVICSDVNEISGNKTVSKIIGNGGSAHFIRADVSDGSEVKALMEQIIKSHNQLDFAFNNAGIGLFDKPIDQCTEEDYDKVMNINSKGVWLCMKYEIPIMLEQQGGCIVNTASQAGLVGGAGLSIYVASKHAVVGFTQSAALEYGAKGIRINSVAPGIIDTQINQPFWDDHPELYEEWKSTVPMKRYGTAEEVAEMVVWLCTKDASFVHGATMPVDAGMLAR
ncbi:MAG: short chain dehydrogenase [Dehalococcoidia bacterium]|nr:short chain dehydrogenase [Dehalococcoidia bacterium]MQG16042.1 glucose 1-dehydrogenase [SAR202 cluster bacterium]